MVDEEFKDDFPALAKEMSEKRTLTHRIDGVRTMSDDEPEEKREHKTFLPDVVDYIRRCDTVNQAIEIVDYLLCSAEPKSLLLMLAKSSPNSEQMVFEASAPKRKRIIIFIMALSLSDA
ncbi:MAG: DUF2095 family protein [Candidatus Thorarchaeota archaeon]|jgi:hypothetical protein